MRRISLFFKQDKAWNNFSISVRIIYLIMLPVMLMLGIIVTFTYYTRLAEVNEELAERGQIIANALAEGSEYGVISGNITDLLHTTKSLVEADNSISQIDIVDAHKKLLLHVVSKDNRIAEQRNFGAPIFKRSIFIDSFAEKETPHVSDLGALTPEPGTAQVIGYVVVKMSPSSLTVKQQNRFYIALIMIFIAAITSIPLALWLSRGLIRQLTTAIAALRAIRSGNYETRVAMTTGGEIGDLQLSINEMATSLNESKRELENKVNLRTQELEASRNEALKSDSEKRRLIQKMNSIVEDERKNIATEIHDELNATLVATQLNAQIILGLVAKCESSTNTQQITEKTQTIINHVASLYSSARTLVRRLRPELLDMLGLHGAIEEVVKNFEELHPNCRFEFYSNSHQITLDSGLEITIYRLVQEALSNSIKHALATKASVVLNLNEAEDFIRIVIVDNGIGFDTGGVVSGMGIIGMKERVHAFNGKIQFKSSEGEGTKIIITFPINRSS